MPLQSQSALRCLSPLRIRAAAFREEQGTVAVEYAFLAFPFFAIIFAIVETCLLIVSALSFDHAVSDVARRVMTGQIVSQNLTSQDFQNEICRQIVFWMNCEQVQVDLRTFPSFADIPTDVPMLMREIDGSEFCFDPGAAESITVLRAFYPWPWTTSFLRELVSDTNGNAIFSSIVPFMNEPFGDAVSSHADCG